MMTRSVQILFIAFWSIVSMASPLPDTIEDRHTRVSMRMIGHQILLASGDSTSLVLPVEKEENGYRIRFDSDFEFIPEELVGIVDRVLRDGGIEEGYIVEVEDCESGTIVHSYEKGNSIQDDLIPCQGRLYPKTCYSLLINILYADDLVKAITDSEQTELLQEPEEGKAWMFIGILVGMAIILLVFFRKKKSKVSDDPDVIPIGAYRFDKRNMELSFGDEKVELTSKEADLLFLLYASNNTTLEREHILKMVWGDDGDYIGRTLDVFVSKLRKKLQGDPSLKIINIRGIGYKLIMNDPNN